MASMIKNNMAVMNRNFASHFYMVYSFFAVLIIMAVGFCLLPFSIDKNNTKSAEEVFQSSLNSVVEIKATTEDVGESFGTAVFVKEDGTLVTNAHVVTYKQMDEYKTFESISIRFAFEERYQDVELIKYDNDLDIAVLKIKNTNCDLKPIEMGDSKSLKAGNDVYAIGNLNNVGVSLTRGIVSNPSINVAYNGKTRNVIQCNLTIADGNSGGALVDENGKLIGITTFRLKDSSQNVIYGIAYCVPIHTVLQYINQ